MGAPFAVAEQSVGVALMATLANGWMRYAGNPDVPIIFSRRAANAPVGSLGMRVREITATCASANLVAPVAVATPVVCYYGDQVVTPAGSYLVQERADDIEPGLTRLDLEVAA